MQCCNAVVERNLGTFCERRHLAEETRKRLPLFVFLSRFPKTSLEIRREAFLFISITELWGCKTTNKERIEKVMKKQIMVLATVFAAAMPLMVEAEVIVPSSIRATVSVVSSALVMKLMTICNGLKL